ncbi:MAG: sulfite exporter TauE/SafE family protein [bacterium]|nr:sulfite exporter TauE/SafE family protein [Candidatus Kapabacteria bacterium]
MTAYLEIALAALIAGTLDTVAGFGGGLLLLPILVLTAGSRDAVLLSAIIPLGWNIVRIIMLRTWIRPRAVALFALGIVPGAIAGAFLFVDIDPDLLRRAIGIILVVFGAYYIVRLYFDLPAAPKISEWWFPFIGLASGIVGSVLGAGHGPMQSAGLTSAAFAARDVAATNGALGGLTAVARLAGYAAAGSLHESLWIPGLIGVVAGAIGAVIGIRISRKSKDTTLELVIGGAMVLAGIRMIL